MPTEIETFEAIKKKAIAGETEAQYELGKAYHLGKGTPVNYPEAHRWFVICADSGCPPAFHAIGLMHKHGHGVEKNLLTASQFFITSVKLGYEDALVGVESIYQEIMDSPWKSGSESFNAAAVSDVATKLRGAADIVKNIGAFLTDRERRKKYTIGTVPTPKP